MSMKFNGVDSKFNDIESKFNNVDPKFNDVDSKLNHIDSNIASDMNSTGTPPQVTGYTDLTQLENGTSAKVIELRGGHQYANKLEAMEIIPGAIIVKKSASLMKGPIVIEKGNAQFAIGYGMAKKIIVEPVSSNHRRTFG